MVGIFKIYTDLCQFLPNHFILLQGLSGYHGTCNKEGRIDEIWCDAL